MATSASQVAAAHAALARNLLSSVLALAFPDHLASDAAAQREFLLQLPQLRALLAQHNVFDFVTDGRALDKFYARLFELIDTPQSVDKAAKAAAFELLLVAVEQCPLDALEQLAPRLTERVLKMVKYLKDAPRVAALASDVARVLVRHTELYAPDVRRDLHDWLAKLLPASVAVLADLVAKAEPLSDDDVALFRSTVGVFIELLEVAPSAVRSTQAKLEAAVAALALYNPAISGDAAAARSAAQCLALAANASDKPHALWKQIVDKAVEMAHQLVDPVAGKRVVTAAAPTGMKVWLRENGGSHGAADLEALAVYQRAQLLLQRLDVVVRVLEASMANRAVSEREVQLVLGDVVALTRRLVTVRAHEVGKQSAISEDGFRLPVSVVYGALPQLHALGLRCLNAVVARAGLCALRHASKIAKVLVLASENAHADAHAALYESVAVCVRVLGASTLEKIGQPLLDHAVAQCKQDLQDDDRAAKKTDAEPTENAKGKGSKSKKRKRAIGDLSQLSADAASSSARFLSTRNQRVLVGNVDAALSAIAACVAVYGSLLPSDTRALASDVALLAVQQQTKRRAMAATSNAPALDSVALLLLTDAATADANSAHAINLVKSVDYWSSSSSSTLLELAALNVSEALVHPRAPPLSLNFDSAIQAHTAPSTATGNGALFRSGPMVPAAAAVRGRMDWDREDTEEKATDETEENDAAAKRAKTVNETDEDVEMADPSKQEAVDAPKEENNEEEDEEEEDEEESYDDERPVAAEPAGDDDEEDDNDAEEAPAASAAATVRSNDGDDDDDDEFPDIVVDDEDDE